MTISNQSNFSMNFQLIFLFPIKSHYIVCLFRKFSNSFTSKTCLKRPLKKTKNWFSRPIITKCRSNVLQEHSAILSTFIKLPFAIKTSVLSFFERPPTTGVTVLHFDEDHFTLVLLYLIHPDQSYLHSNLT